MRCSLRCVVGTLIVVVGSLLCFHAHGEERADIYLQAMEAALDGP